MADVEHRVPVCKTVKVYPIAFVSRLNQVPHLVVAMDALVVFLNSFGKVTNLLQSLLSKEGGAVQRLHHLLPPAWEKVRLAGGGKEFFAFFA